MLKIKDIIKKNKKINFELVLLLAHILNKPKEFIYTHGEQRLNLIEYLKLKYYTRLLKQNYPLAYVTKNKEFFNLNFFVNKYVLIPRPDTEIIVEQVLELLKKQKNTPMLLIDIGTGSGCIPISILKNIDKKISTWGVDISTKALKVAKKNATRHHTDIKFLKSDLINNKVIKNKLSQKTKTIITANLPYLNKQQYEEELSIRQEPKSALVAEKKGLDFYYKLITQIKSLHQKNQMNIFLEIDPSQTKLIKNYIKRELPQSEIKIKKDLAGLERVVYIKIDSK